MSVAKDAISGFKWTAGGKVVGQIFNWSITIFVIRLLSPQDYGIFAIALIVTAYLTMLREFGIGNGLIQKNEFSTKILRKVLGLVILINTFFFILLLLISPYISTYYEKPILEEIFNVQAFQFLVLVFAVLPDAKLRNELKFKELSIIQLVSTMIGGVVTLVLALNDLGVWSLVWGNFSRITVSTLMLQTVSFTMLTPDFRIRNLNGIANYGMIVMLNRTLFFIYNKIDVFITAKILPITEVGYYTVAKDLATLPMAKMGSSVNIVAFSAFTKYENKREELKRHYLKAVESISFIAFPIFFGISAVTEELVPIFLGDKWLAVTPCLQLIALAVPFRLLNLINGPLFEGIGSPLVHTNIIAAAVLLYVPAFFIFSEYGIVVVALIWVVVTPLHYLYALSWVKKKIGVGMFQVMRVITVSLIVSMIMLIVVMAVSQIPDIGEQLNAWIIMSMKIGIGIVVYLGLFLLLDREKLGNFVKLVFSR
ncbi:MAG: lipopolysaccharide biosynthesis protein [Sedimenticola sp.]